MIPLLLILIAALSYGLGALSSAMLLSKFVFHKDLSKLGSRRVNYANFVRVFGTKWGPAALAVDVLKAAVAVLAGGLIMLIVDSDGSYVTVGRLFAGFCAVLGDMYPVQHQFRGGKGTASCITALWLSDWRVGLVATGVFVIVVAFSQYVSLAGMAACFAGALATWLFTASEDLRGLCGTLAFITALLIIWRHRGSIFHILEHREPKVKWGRSQTDRRMREDKF